MRYLLGEINRVYGTRFMVTASADLEGIMQERLEFSALLDTGCSLTKIALIRAGVPGIDGLLENDIQRYRSNVVELAGSFGVSDLDRSIDLKDVSEDDLRSNPNICFKHGLKGLRLNNYFIGDFDCKVSYIQTGLSLIGMNILKYFEWHVGYSSKVKTTVLIACLRKSLNRDFFIALHSHFGLLPSRDRLRILNDKGILTYDDPFVVEYYV